jgi:hypothetical protein
MAVVLGHAANSKPHAHQNHPAEDHHGSRRLEDRGRAHNQRLKIHTIQMRAIV